MARDENDARLRAYVLGAGTEEDSADIEREYFERADHLDRVRAAEDDLIEDYLSARLTPEERDRFERYYLISPAHRARVAVIAALGKGRAADSNRRHEPRRWLRSWSSIGQMAAAAVIIAVIAVSVWDLVPQRAPESVSVGPGAPRTSRPDETLPASPPTPTVATVVLAPILVRGSGDPAIVTVPQGIDLVRLQLLGEGERLRFSGQRATIRTVSGEEVWTGPGREPAGQGAQEIATIDVPAARLRPDDYVLTLFGRNADGREVEQYRYYLRVR